MVQFDAELKKRKRRSGGGWRKVNDVNMDDVDDDSATAMDSEQCLEETGECIDDVYYKECK